MTEEIRYYFYNDPKCYFEKPIGFDYSCGYTRHHLIPKTGYILINKYTNQKYQTVTVSSWHVNDWDEVVK